MTRSSITPDGSLRIIFGLTLLALLVYPNTWTAGLFAASHTEIESFIFVGNNHF